MNKKDKKPVATKIDVDEQTNEPIIVDAKDSEIAELSKIEVPAEDTITPRDPSKYSEKDFVRQSFLCMKDEEKNQDRRKKIFKTIFMVLSILFIVGSLTYIFITDFFSGGPINWSQIGSVLSNNWYYIFFGFIALGMVFLVKGLQRSIISKSFTGKFRLKTSIETGLVGQMYNLVTPLAVGGQPFEVHYLSKHGVSGGHAAAIPIGTYIINQIAGVSFGFMCLMFFAFNVLGPISVPFPSTIIVLTIIGLVLSLCMPLAVGIFCFFPRLSAKLVRFVINIGGKLKLVKNPKITTYKVMRSVSVNSKCLKSLFKRPIVFFSVFLLSIAEHLAMNSTAYFSLRFFGFDWVAPGFLEWMQIMMRTQILGCGVSFMPTPGSSGAAELSFNALFHAVLLQGLAFPSMMVWRILCFYSFIIIGFIFIRVKKSSDKKRAIVYDNIDDSMPERNAPDGENEN